MSNSEEPIADSVDVAIKRLSISKTSMYGEIKSGRMVALKAGGRTLISRVEQERWLNALPRLVTTNEL